MESCTLAELSKKYFIYIEEHLEFGIVYVQLALNMRYMLNFMDEHFIKSIFWDNQVFKIDQNSIVEFGDHWVSIRVNGLN